MITVFAPTEISSGHRPILFTVESEAVAYINNETIDPENWQVQEEVIFDSITEYHDYVGYTAEDVVKRLRRIAVLKQSRQEGWDNIQLKEALEAVK